MVIRIRFQKSYKIFYKDFLEFFFGHFRRGEPGYTLQSFYAPWRIKRISTTIPNATDARIENYLFKALERFLMIF